MYFESNVRGEISTISRRYARSNVPGSPEIDPNLPPFWILYIDANNLYGMAMASYIPTSDFKCIDDPQSFDVTSIPDDSPIGYVIECDLIYPPELHD